MSERLPWLPPERFDEPGEVWRAARLLSDEPESRWTFSLFALRAMVEEDPNGLNMAYEDLTTWNEVVAALILQDLLAKSGISSDLAFSVTLGMSIFDSALRSTTGRFIVPAGQDKFRGRHAIAAVAWDHARELIVVANSWGPSWGDGGLGYIDSQYFEACVDSVLVKRAAWLGPSLAMNEKMRVMSWAKAAPGRASTELIVGAWGTPNGIRSKKVEIRGVDHRLSRRTLFSIGRGEPFEVIELREGDKLKGRLHLVHDRRAEETALVEFWVPPSVRRQGNGTYMEGVARELSRAAGSKKVSVRLHEADASAIGVPRARAFASRLGYRWRRRRTSRPNVVAVATKRLS